MESVAERIKIFGEMLKSVETAYLTVFDSSFNVVSSTTDHFEVMTNFLSIEFNNDEGSEDLLQDENMVEICKRIAPSVFSNSLGMVWISDVYIKEGMLENIYLLGPVFLDDYSVLHIEKELDILNLSMQLKHRFMKCMMSMPIISLNRLYEYGIMLHYCITQNKIMVSDYHYPLLSSDDRDTIFRFKHGTYMAEQEILRLVEEGNLEYKEVFDKYISIGQMGNMGNGLYLRQEKNTVIMFVTLCSRASIRGGLASETAFSLCDKYITEVEKTADISALTKLSHEMFRDFIYRVHRIKMDFDQISPQIQKACDYISLHLDAKTDIHCLAKMLGYSDYYFSNKFKQEVGKSVRDYIMDAKIKKAKSLLRDSNLPVQEISDFLGYGTQSYFGEVFRKLTGKTPNEYRNQNRQ